MSEILSLRERGKTHSMELIFFPLFLLMVVGVIFNGLNSSGLQANGQLSTTTTMCLLNVDPNCSPIINPTPTGCALNPQNCNASSMTGFSILNQNSPFTLLMQGNIIGFLTSTFNNGEILNTYQIGETVCIPLINGHLGNATGNSIHNFQCYGNVQYNYEQNPTVFPLMNATANYGNNSIWSIIGCSNLSCGLSFNGTLAQSSFYGIYVLNGTTITASHGCYIYGSVPACALLFPNLFGSNPAFTCPNTAHVTGININRTTYYCLLPTNDPNTFSVNNTFAFFAMISGLILLFMGFGLTFAFSVLTNGGTIGFNPQGTKLAQCFGIGLVIWSFITSEFGYWALTSYGSSTIGLILNMILGSTYTILTVMFFLGLWWRLFSLD